MVIFRVESMLFLSIHQDVTEFENLGFLLKRLLNIRMPSISLDSKFERAVGCQKESLYYHHGGSDF